MDILKIMIVDDEILAIEDIINLIPWQQHGFEIVATATDGKIAFDLFNKYLPDIVLVDIRMPVINGIEFSRMAISTGHQVKIIILTAYKDFNYAKEALKLGVSSYLVKHEINAESLIRELSIARNELKKCREESSIIRQQVLKHMMKGKITPHNVVNWKEENDVFKEMKPVVMYVYSNKPFRLVKGDYPSTDLDMVNIIHSIKVESSEGFNYIETVEMDENEGIILFAVEKALREGKVWEKGYTVASYIKDKLKTLCGCTFSVIISSVTNGALTISELYKSARNSSKYSIFIGVDKVFRPEDIIKKEKIGKSVTTCNIQGVITHLKEMNKKATGEYLDRLFDDMGRFEWDYDNLVGTCQKLLDIMSGFKAENNLSISNELSNTPLYSLYDIKNYFKTEYEVLIDEADNTRIPPCSKRMEQALKFIHRYYAEDLVLDEVAVHLGISGIYLSQLFKKEMKKTFLEYLTHIRMKKAMEMLNSGSFKIYEVAEKVGYKTSQYFSHIFHKYTGMNPLEWRERR